MYNTYYKISTICILKTFSYHFLFRCFYLFFLALNKTTISVCVCVMSVPDAFVISSLN